MKFFGKISDQNRGTSPYSIISDIKSILVFLDILYLLENNILMIILNHLSLHDFKK